MTWRICLIFQKNMQLNIYLYIFQCWTSETLLANRLESIHQQTMVFQQGERPLGVTPRIGMRTLTTSKEVNVHRASGLCLEVALHQTRSGSGKHPHGRTLVPNPQQFLHQKWSHHSLHQHQPASAQCQGAHSELQSAMALTHLPLSVDLCWHELQPASA